MDVGENVCQHTHNLEPANSLFRQICRQEAEYFMVQNYYFCLFYSFVTLNSPFLAPFGPFLTSYDAKTHGLILREG